MLDKQCYQTLKTSNFTFCFTVENSKIHLTKNIAFPKNMKVSHSREYEEEKTNLKLPNVSEKLNFNSHSNITKEKILIPIFLFLLHDPKRAHEKIHSTNGGFNQCQQTALIKNRHLKDLKQHKPHRLSIKTGTGSGCFRVSPTLIYHSNSTLDMKRIREALSKGRRRE